MFGTVVAIYRVLADSRSRPTDDDPYRGSGDV